MRKKILVIGVVIAICLVAGSFFLLTKEEKTPEELTLSDFPEAFKRDTVIVLGENASQIEKESAEAIAASLKNLTGNKPEISNTKK